MIVVGLFSLEFLHEVFPTLDGGVDAVGGEGEEEGVVLFFDDDLDRFLSESIGEILPLFFVLEVGIVIGRVVTALGRGAAVKAGNVYVKSLGERVISEVPLAELGSKVASRFEDFGKSENLVCKGLGIGCRDELAVLGLSSF